MENILNCLATVSFSTGFLICYLMIMCWPFACTKLIQSTFVFIPGLSKFCSCKPWPELLMRIRNICNQGCTDPGLGVACAAKFDTFSPNIREFCAWNFLHIALPPPWILRRLLDFWKICVALLITFHFGHNAVK